MMLLWYLRSSAESSAPLKKKKTGEELAREVLAHFEMTVSPWPCCIADVGSASVVRSLADDVPTHFHCT